MRYSEKYHPLLVPMVNNSDHLRFKDFIDQILGAFICFFLKDGPTISLKTNSTRGRNLSATDSKEINCRLIPDSHHVCQKCLLQTPGDQGQGNLCLPL